MRNHISRNLYYIASNSRERHLCGFQVGEASVINGNQFVPTVLGDIINFRPLVCNAQRIYWKDSNWFSVNIIADTNNLPCGSSNLYWDMR